MQLSKDHLNSIGLRHAKITIDCIYVVELVTPIFL